MNPGGVVVAGVVGNHVVIPARNINAGRVMMAGIIRNRRPGTRQPDALSVIMTIVVDDSRLRRILNADTRMGRASRALAARHAHFVVVGEFPFPTRRIQSNPQFWTIT